MCAWWLVAVVTHSLRDGCPKTRLSYGECLSRPGVSPTKHRQNKQHAVAQRRRKQPGELKLRSSFAPQVPLGGASCVSTQSHTAIACLRINTPTCGSGELVLLCYVMLLCVYVLCVLVYLCCVCLLYCCTCYLKGT